MQILRVATDHRLEILRAAASLFASKPFHEVLMEDVAAASGIAKGTVYRFYQNKEELYSAIVFDIVAKHIAKLEGILLHTQGCQKQIECLVRCSVDHYREHWDFFRVMQRSSLSMLGDPKFLAMRRGLREIYAEVIREGQKQGLWSGPAPALSADMTLGMMRNLLVYGDPKLSAKEVSDAILDVLLHGLSRSRKKEA